MKIRVRWVASGVVLVACLVLGFALGMSYGSATASPNPQTDRDALFAPFWETWDLLHSSYVDPLDDTGLMEAALSGMVDSLGDPHSFYMDPETFSIANSDLSGEFQGIGATVRQDADTGALRIVDTLPDSPAQQAGLMSGDAIVTVDGEDITDLPLNETIGLIRGPEDTSVDLGIQREDNADLITITVTRATIQIPELEVRTLDNGIVYIRLYQFGAGATEALHDALVAQDVEHSPGLILDLRGNPGGYLSTAVDVASEFLPSGLVLKERFRDRERDYPVNGDPIAPDVPLVVLVDEGSASASELVSGAFQDQGRATIIGMPTFGKGSVQTWRELSNGGGVRVTIARWYTPNDRTIQDVGLTPDIEVPSQPDAAQDDQLQAALDYLRAHSTVTAQQ